RLPPPPAVDPDAVHDRPEPGPHRRPGPEPVKGPQRALQRLLHQVARVGVAADQSTGSPQQGLLAGQHRQGERHVGIDATTPPFLVLRELIHFTLYPYDAAPRRICMINFSGCFVYRFGQGDPAETSPFPAAGTDTILAILYYSGPRTCAASSDTSVREKPRRC